MNKTDEIMFWFKCYNFVFTYSDHFSILEDICKCNTIVSGIRRGHPGRCNHYVECVNMTVPVGKACPDGQCRRSMTGICTNDCSENVCNETVPEGNCVVNIEFVRCCPNITDRIISSMHGT